MRAALLLFALLCAAAPASAQQPSFSVPVTIDKPVPVTIVEDPSAVERDRQREEKADVNSDADLVEQRRAADAATRAAQSAERQETFAWWQLLASGAATIAVLVAIGVALRANSIARATGRDQARAYVHVDKVVLSWGDRRASRPQVLITVRNSGQTPAKWFAVKAMNVVSGPAPDYDWSALDFGDRVFRRWNALRPHGKLSLSRMSEPETDVLRAAYGQQNQSLQVVGTVRYETFFGEIFETDFWFVLRSIPEYAVGNSVTLPSGARINTEHLWRFQRASTNLRTFARVKR